jgi:hypothetical protein
MRQPGFGHVVHSLDGDFQFNIGGAAGCRDDGTRGSSFNVTDGDKLRRLHVNSHNDDDNDILLEPNNDLDPD